MIKTGDRVKYAGKIGAGLPFKGEIGIVEEVFSDNKGGSLVRVKLRGDNGKITDESPKIQLPLDQFKPAPIIVPIVGYSVLSMALLTLTWRLFSRR